MSQKSDDGIANAFQLKFKFSARNYFIVKALETDGVLPVEERGDKVLSFLI